MQSRSVTWSIEKLLCYNLLKLLKTKNMKIINKKGMIPNMESYLFIICGRWDLNPHKRNAYKILSLARLPVPTLPHKRLFSIARRLYYYTFRKKATTIFAFFHLFCSFANCFDFVLSFFHLDWQYRVKHLTRVRNRTTL